MQVKAIYNKGKLEFSKSIRLTHKRFPVQVILPDEVIETKINSAAATSFFPAKPLGCYGDGGAVLTDDDDELAEHVRSIRVHGKGTDKYDNIRIGLNARLHTLQAARPAGKT